MEPEPLGELSEPELYYLYRKDLPELGESSCHELLAEMIEDRWSTLAHHACQQRKAAIPAKADALRAFDSLKHGFFAKDLDLLSFSLPELWRAIWRMSLRDLGIVASAVLAIAGFSFWAGAKFG